jgi:CHAT domain-containing protein
VEPLLGELQGVDELIVIPSGPMLGVPLEAVRDDAGALMGDRYAISYVPSATVYVWLAERAEAHERSRGSALLLGDPVFSAQEPTAEADGDESEAIAALLSDLIADERFARGVLTGRSDRLASLPRLSWTRAEILAVADILPGSKVLLGTDASEQMLVRLAEEGWLEDCAILHLATHALVDDRKPSRSALVLSQDHLPDPLDAAIAGERVYDGLVTAGEILREWSLNADLVVLSACETGLGRRVEGEGYIGLSNAILQAGARSLIVSLWEVEDRATALLMSRFYRNWLGDEGERGGRAGQVMSKARALQEAKQWLATYTDELGRRPYEHPYYWSAFILVGDRS